MPDPIRLTVQEETPISLSPDEELRIIRAVSPTVTMEQITGGAVITITDLNGPHAVTLSNGTDGRGIASATLNDDYTLTITYTDGTSYATPSIRGERGAGITSIAYTGTSGLVDTYTITYGDGQTATFTVTNGADGVSPTVLIQTFTGGHRITITDAEHPSGQSVDVMDGEPGTPGTSSYVWIRYAAQEPTADDDMKTTPDAWIGIASGNSATAPEHYTDYVWYKIKGETGPVQDVQINGTSILSNGVANIPLADNQGNPGVIRTVGEYGFVKLSSNNFAINKAQFNNIKAGKSDYKPIVPANQHMATFYGLAKAAGDTSQSASSDEVGSYTDSAIDKIMAMLGVDALIGPHEAAATASEAKSIGDVFIFAGKLYKATDSIAQGAAIVPGTNCTQTNLIGLIRGA